MSVTQELLFFFAVVIATISVCFGGAYSCSVASCEEGSRVMGRRTEHHISSGCYVEVNGEMIPVDNWRADDE